MAGLQKRRSRRGCGRLIDQTMLPRSAGAVGSLAPLLLLLLTLVVGGMASAAFTGPTPSSSSQGIAPPQPQWLQRQWHAAPVIPSVFGPQQPKQRGRQLRAVVGTGGGSRRRGRGGRGRGEGGGDGRPSNMSDSDYEAFFAERERKRALSYEQQIEAAYYDGADKNVKFLRDDPSAWDGTPDAFSSLSRGQALGIGAAALLGAGGIVVGQRWSLLKRYTSPGAFQHPYDPQTLRRPFSSEQLRAAVRKAKSKGLGSLPPAPSASALASLPFIRGSAQGLQAALGDQSRIVVYHFWRPSNLNSLATLSKLEALLARSSSSNDDDDNGTTPTQIEVVSLLCPKYDPEGGGSGDGGGQAFVESAVARAEHAIGRPLKQHVVWDRSLSVWKDKGLEQWPSVAVSAPGGERVLFFVLGDRAAGSSAVEKAVAATRQVLLQGLKEGEEGEGGGWNVKPLEADAALLTQARAAVATAAAGSPLRFPSDAVWDEESGKLFVVDSGNHRILALDPQSGRIERVIGAGRPGFQDGYGPEALFRFPQGLCLDASQRLLYVADTLNDNIRAIDLKARDAVSTLRPTNVDPKSKREQELGAVHEDILRALGEEGKDPQFASELGLRRTLRLPTQLAIMDGYLYIAAAGSNQIWRADPYSFDLAPALGSGACAVLDRTDPNSNDLSSKSAFAEPTGLAALPGRLVVAEAESSTLRMVDFRERLSPLRTLLGNDRLFKQDLSAFGDRDGYARTAKLQCPTALATLSDSSMLLADTYNHKVKLLNLPQEGEASSSRLAGSGQRGLKDGPGATARFSEPRGLAADSRRNVAYVCDSGNHAIRTVDLRTGQVGTLRVVGE